MLRVETIVGELSNDDRLGAGNVSKHLRPLLGQAIVAAEILRAMHPVDDDWRAYRDWIDNVLLAPICGVCEGEGLADLMDDHPKPDWKRWTDIGVNFNTDKEFNAFPIDGAILTDEARSTYIRNFTALRKWRALGHPDDDYLPTPRFMPEVPLAPTTLPHFPGLQAMLRQELAIHWHDVYQGALDALNQSVHPGTYRQFAVMNLLWLLDDRNFTPQRESTSVSGLRANMQLTPAVLGQHAPQDILPVVFQRSLRPWPSGLLCRDWFPPT